MTDIYIDPATHDLEIVNNSLRLTRTVEELTRQRLDITLNTFKEEWFANINFGVPYLKTRGDRGVLSKSDVSLLNFEIQRAIRNTEGVERITGYSSQYNETSREVEVTFQAVTETGVLINDTLII